MRILLAAAYALLMYTAARALLHQIGSKSRVLAAGLAVVLTIAFPYALGRALNHLGLALAATAVAAIACVVLLWKRAPRYPADDDPPLRLGWPWLVLAALLFAAVASTALRGYYFDEDWVHYALSSAIARGVIPLEHPALPGEPFLYHYGFNVLTAEVMVLADLSVDAAIDVVRLGGFLLLLAAAARLGAVLGGRRGARLALVLLPLGGSPLTYLLFRGMGRLELAAAWVPDGWVARLAPPVITNYFQPPQGLGMPMAVIALLILHAALERTGALRTRWLVLLAIHLGALAAIQIVLFVLLGFGSAAALLTGARPRWPQLLREGAILALGVVVAYLLGGFFEASSPATEDAIIFGKSFFDEPLHLRLLHYLFLGGLPLLLVPFSLSQHRSPVRVAFASAALLGIALFDRLTYARSWDSIKFLTVALFLANLAAVDGLARRRVPAIAAALLALATVTTGALWLARTTIFDGRLDIHRWRETPPPEIALAFLERFDAEIPPYERVLTGDTRLSKAGFLTPGFDWQEVGLYAHMLDRARSEAKARARRRALSTLDEAALDELGVCWLALSDQELARLSRRLAGNAAYQRVDRVTVGGDARTLYRRSCAVRTDTR